MGRKSEVLDITGPLGFVCEFGGEGRGRFGKKGMSKWKK